MARVMIDRRKLLKCSIALPLASGCGLSVAGALGSSSMSLSKVIYDETNAVSHAFADEARQQGYPVTVVSEPMSAVWFDELSPRLKSGSGGIAGLTDMTTAYVFETLARDAGMKTYFRGLHRVSGAANHSHRIDCRAFGADQHEVELHGDKWGRSLFRMMAAINPLSIHAVSSLEYAPMTSAEFGSGRHLVSWLIASPAGTARV